MQKNTMDILGLIILSIEEYWWELKCFHVYRNVSLFGGTGKAIGQCSHADERRYSIKIIFEAFFRLLCEFIHFMGMKFGA